MLARKTPGFLLAMLAAGVLLIGCGGGGGGDTQAASTSGTTSLLTWSPPTSFRDNTVMDPYTDLDYYEVYIRTDQNFTDNDLPVAQVAAVADVPSPDGQTVVRTLVTEFTLELVPHIPAGNRLYVSLKAVGIDRQRSAFMPWVTWNRV